MAWLAGRRYSRLASSQPVALRKLKAEAESARQRAAELQQSLDQLVAEKDELAAVLQGASEAGTRNRAPGADQPDHLEQRNQELLDSLAK